MKKMLRGFVVMVLVVMGTTRFQAKAEIYDCHPISTEMTNSTQDVYLLSEEADKIICVTVNAQLTTEGVIWKIYKLLTSLFVGPTSVPGYVNYANLDREETLANVHAYALRDYIGIDYEMVASERDVLDQLVADGGLTIVNRTYAYVHMQEHKDDLLVDESDALNQENPVVRDYLTGHYVLRLCEFLPRFNAQVAENFIDQIKDTQNYATWSGQGVDPDLQTPLPY